MFDGDGNAVLHLNTPDFPRQFDRAVGPDADTGAIHHVAFRCSDFDAVKTRLDAREAEYQINEVPSAGLRQIFTSDPNNVLLELNFFTG